MGTRPIRQPGVNEGIANDATTNMEVRAALRSLPNHVIDDVEVSYHVESSYYIYRVTFNSAATQGNQHLLKCNFRGLQQGWLPTPSERTQGYQPQMPCFR